MLSKGDRYRKALQGFLESEWQEYPRYIQKMESVTLDEWTAHLRLERGAVYAGRRIEFVSHVVDAIDRVYNAAPDDVKELVRIRYWDSKEITGWTETARLLGVSMSKAVRMNKALIFKTADILGFWWDR